MLLIFPILVVAHQFWLALARNILMAVNYSYPALLCPFLFVLDTTTLIIHEGGTRFLGCSSGVSWQFWAGACYNFSFLF